MEHPWPNVIKRDMPFQPGHKISGSRKGKPNRIKRDAREAIARFVDGNAHKLQRWLDTISEGLREPDLPDGKKGKWIVPPNPEKAFVLFQSVIEYHVPKLSRREVVTEDKPNGRLIDSSQLTAEQREQLRQMILAQPEPALLKAQAPNVVEPAGLGDAQVIDNAE